MKLFGMQPSEQKFDLGNLLYLEPANLIDDSATSRGHGFGEAGFLVLEWTCFSSNPRLRPGPEFQAVSLNKSLTSTVPRYK